MTGDEFEASLTDHAPPAGGGPLLRALWLAVKGDWAAAHELAQAQHDEDGAWVHAHLHRMEGDLANAGYWYQRAGRPVCEQPLEDERRALAAALGQPRT